MATKKIEDKQTKRLMDFTRKVVLAYVGAFGVAADEFGKLFDRFVVRGERIEKEARKLVKQNEKDMRHFAQQVQKEQKVAVAKANKNVKRAVKRIEALA